MKKMTPGNCYYMLSYFDEGLRLPLIETYVYLGHDLRGEEARDTGTI